MAGYQAALKELSKSAAGLTAGNSAEIGRIVGANIVMPVSVSDLEGYSLVARLVHVETAVFIPGSGITIFGDDLKELRSKVHSDSYSIISAKLNSQEINQFLKSHK